MKMLALALILCASSALAAPQGVMEKDANGGTVQGGAPNGELSRYLTGISWTNDGKDLWWAVYTTTDCKMRLQKTSAKGSYPQATIPSGQWVSRVVNRATPFVNLSGCVGELQRQ